MIALTAVMMIFEFFTRFIVLPKKLSIKGKASRKNKQDRKG